MPSGAGFFIAFMPLYLLGFMGVTRRLNHYEEMGLKPMFVVAAIGIVVIFIGVFFQALQIIVSIKQRNENRDTTGDPWGGRNLEWSTTSPPPFYNYAVIPEVHGRDAFWAMKHSNEKVERPPYEAIHIPKNTAIGFYIGVLSFLFSFGVIWFMWWLAIIGGVGMVVCLIVRLFQQEVDYHVSAEEVEKIESRKQNA